MSNILLVGVGGFFGAALRYLMTLIPWFNNSAAWKIWLCNIIGSFLIGLFSVVLKSDGQNLLLTVGFLGAFTTFSTFSLGVVKMLQSSQYLLGMVHIAVSVIGCILLTFLGIFLGKFMLN